MFSEIFDTSLMLNAITFIIYDVQGQKLLHHCKVNISRVYPNLFLPLN
ncbi:MAG: hypothetical protein JWQ66_192 [Mucilaginibacter sp.]|nr:hypothetical protein [Mucilaginibacter sp.]